MAAKAIHSAAFDKVFHGPLVQFPFPHPLKEILQGFEGAALLALADHGPNQAVADVLHRTETKADRIALHHKVVIGVVDIRGQHRDIQFLTFGDVTGYFGGRIQHGGHQRRHILLGIVAFQVRRLVGHHRVAHGMGLVEGVVCKGNDLIVDGLAHAFADPALDAAVNILGRVTIDEGLPFRFDNLHLFLGDGAADIVRLAHGIAAQLAEYLNDLL